MDLLEDRRQFGKREYRGSGKLKSGFWGWLHNFLKFCTLKAANQLPPKIVGGYHTCPTWGIVQKD